MASMNDHPILGYVLACACIYAIVYGIRENILITVTIMACVFLVFWGLNSWNEHRLEVAESQKLCPHGIQGGMTRNKCEACANNLQAEIKRRELERLESRRLQEIKDAALSLKFEESKRLTQQSLGKMDVLMSSTPRAFEDTVAEMFRKMGYSVKQTPYSSDGGKDAIAMKDGKKVLIECKRYEKGMIGRPALQKFYAAIMEEKAEKGIFVTTSGFTRTALDYEYVRSNLIQLIDGKTLVNMMIYAFPESSDSRKYKAMCPLCGSQVTFDLVAGEVQKMCPNNHPVDNDFQPEMLSLAWIAGKVFCEKCGRPMRYVHGKRGRYWVCTGYPECKHTRPYK